MSSPDESSGSGRPRRFRARSALWSAVLIPFLFLPYRWIWLPCALAASLTLICKRPDLRASLRRDGTLIVGSTLVLIVRTLLDPAWWLPWLAVMALVFAMASQRRFSPRVRIAMAALVWPIAAALLLRPDLSFREAISRDSIPTERVLVCAGDSLTSGVDYRSDADTYVARLRDRLPCRVVNAGRANDETADLLKRVKSDVLARDPTVVLLFIGGNDYLGGTPRSQFAEDLDTLARNIAESGARIVMVEVPSGIVWNPYAGVYRRLARRYDANLVPETRLRWWYSKELIARDLLAEPLTIDGIHLSPAGATRVADWLEPYVKQALAGPRETKGL